jgi:hypothetical protein
VKWLVLFVLLLGAGFAALFHFYLSPDARHERAALRLIQVMGIDEVEFKSYQLIMRRSHERGRLTEAQYRCASEVTQLQLAKLYVPEIKAHLNQYQAERAIEFFGSSLGEKFMDAVNFEVNKRAPDALVEVVSEEPRFDIDELESLWAFSRTALGRQAWDVTAVVAESQAIPQLMRERLALCKK